MPNEAIWKVKIEEDGEYTVYPAKPLFLPKAIEIANKVPGARVDTRNGYVTGPLHHMLACLRLAGQPIDDRVGIEDSSGVVEFEGVKLPDFQSRGAAFTASRLLRGVQNNDDVGLGKTVQTIAALSTYESKDFARVILCPAFLRSQWKGEIEKWGALFDGGRPQSVHVVWPPSDKRSKKPVEGTPKWIVAFYLDAQRAKEVARIGGRRYILVMDEAHNLRGFGTNRAKAIHDASLWATGRISLTASPLYNTPDRLWPILDYTSPGDWGGYWAFAKRYAGAEENPHGGLLIGKITNVDELRLRLATMSFRRTKEEVWDQLPFDVKYQTIWLDPPGGHIGQMKAALADIAHPGKGLGATAIHMRQVAMAKVDPVVQTIMSDREAGSGSITFTWLRDHAAAIAAAVPDSMLVLGGEAPGQRLDRIAAYLGKCKIRRVAPALVGTLGALGEGANLQFARSVNLAALDYTPDILHQAVGRAARMGQTGTVSVRLFACKQTIDEHIVGIVVDKLREQMRLAGKKEKAKVDMENALTPTATKEALRAIYERALKEERES